jgi:hypothetical protein
LQLVHKSCLSSTLRTNERVEHQAQAYSKRGLDLEKIAESEALDVLLPDGDKELLKLHWRGRLKSQHEEQLRLGPRLCNIPAGGKALTKSSNKESKKLSHQT